MWAKGLPVVRVPQGEAPKHVTIVMPYYENAAFFAQQVSGWLTFPAQLRAHLSAIVVDDGSPLPAAFPAELPFPIRLFRIEEDVRWNWLAARNIGMQYANGWCVLTDMDHVLPEATARALVYGQHAPAHVYGFIRLASTREKLQPHSASFFLTKRMFWKVGGYDERLAGYYGTDGYFRRRVLLAAPVQILAEPLVRHEYELDSSTTRYQRKQPEDDALHALAASLKGTPPQTLTYPYHEVTA